MGLISIEKDVLWLQVLVNYVFLVQVLEGLQDLSSYIPNPLDVHLSLFGHLIKVLLEVTPFHQFHNNVKFLLSLAHFGTVPPHEIHVFDYARVSQLATDTELLEHLLEGLCCEWLVVQYADHLAYADDTLGVVLCRQLTLVDFGLPARAYMRKGADFNRIRELAIDHVITRNFVIDFYGKLP